MELGVFSLTEIYPGSPDTAASLIDDIVGYGILAEQSGLDVFGIVSTTPARSQSPRSRSCTPRSLGRPAVSRSRPPQLC
jgi:hypothetical protein